MLIDCWVGVAGCLFKARRADIRQSWGPDVAGKTSGEGLTAGPTLRTSRDYNFKTIHGRPSVSRVRRYRKDRAKERNGKICLTCCLPRFCCESIALQKSSASYTSPQLVTAHLQTKFLDNIQNQRHILTLTPTIPTPTQQKTQQWPASAAA